MKNILITGASSGIGRALSIELFKKYYNANFFLCGRNSINLGKTKSLMVSKNNAKHVKAQLFAFDINNFEDVRNTFSYTENKGGLDLVIVNAGVSAGTLGGIESFEQIEEIFLTNFISAAKMVNLAAQGMIKRKSGQIAVISSVAGLRGLPSSPAYSASKAGIRVYGEAMRGFLQKYNVKLSVVCPGYVKTPMTDVNTFPMPLIITADRCANLIVKGLERNKARINTHPLMFKLVNFLTYIGPDLTDWFFNLLPAKSAKPLEPMADSFSDGGDLGAGS